MTDLLPRYSSVKIHGAPVICKDLKKTDPHGLFIMPICLPSACTEPGWGIKFSLEPRRHAMPQYGDQGSEPEAPPFIMSCNRNYLKAIVAIFQGIFSLYGLWQARARELHKYGYASFSFTVLPYAIMSLVNLVALLCQPQYATAFLVKYDTSPKENGEMYNWHHGTVAGSKRTQLSFSAEGMNLLMEGAVGSFQLSPRHEVPRDFESSSSRVSQVSKAAMWYGCFRMVVVLVVTITPFVVIHLLVSFRAEESSATSRFFTMFWFTFPPFVVLWFLLMVDRLEKWITSCESTRWLLYFHHISSMVLILIGLLAGIGVYVIVIVMIIDFGVCTVV